MMDIDLDYLEQVAKQATPGTRRPANCEFNAVSVGGEGLDQHGEKIVYRVVNKCDKWFLAALSPQVVLELIRRARSKVNDGEHTIYQKRVLSDNRAIWMPWREVSKAAYEDARDYGDPAVCQVRRFLLSETV